MDLQKPDTAGSDGALGSADPEVLAAVRHGHLIEASRRRWADADTRDRWSLRSGALVFALAAGVLALFTDWSAVRPLVLLLAVVALAVASTVELEVGSASVVPTEPIVVAMLLMLPAGVVPLAIFAALVLSGLYLRLRNVRRESVLVAACSSAFVLGPALVVRVLGLGPAGPRWWLVIALALVAQVGSDLAISWWRNCVGLGVAFDELVTMLRRSYGIDMVLAPGAVVAVIALKGAPVTILVAMCPVVVIALLARERAQHIDTLISLGAAYSDASGRARRDAMTGLGNRFAWDEAINEAATGATGSTGVLMLDVDHLKAVNDRFGHEIGDRLLITVADTIRHLSDSWGLACRLGGDEFGLLVADATMSDLAGLALLVRQQLADQPPIGDVPVSASVGYATAAPGLVLQAVRDADQAMYRSKQMRDDEPCTSEAAPAGVGRLDHP